MMEPLYGTEEWRAARLGRITASNFKSIFAGHTGKGWSEGAIKYALQLTAERSTGFAKESVDTEDTDWGRENEPFAIQAYEHATFCTVQPGKFILKEGTMIGASPDGFVGKEGLVEVKCPATTTHLATIIQCRMPAMHSWQVQGQLWVTGRTWCDFISFDPRIINPDKRLFVQRVMRDEGRITAMSLTLIQFEVFVKKMMSDAGCAIEERASGPNE